MSNNSEGKNYSFFYKFKQFIYKNNYWLWALIVSLVYFVLVILDIYFLKNTLISKESSIFVNGSLSIIALDVALLTFLVSSNNLNMGKHLNIFIKVLFISLLASILILVFYIFWNNYYVIIGLGLISITNLIVAFYYLYYLIKNKTKNIS